MKIFLFVCLGSAPPLWYKKWQQWRLSETILYTIKWGEIFSYLWHLGVELSSWVLLCYTHSNNILVFTSIARLSSFRILFIAFCVIIFQKNCFINWRDFSPLSFVAVAGLLLADAMQEYQRTLISDVQQQKQPFPSQGKRHQASKLWKSETGIKESLVLAVGLHYNQFSFGSGLLSKFTWWK